VDACSREFETSPELIHVSSSDLKTSHKTDRSLTAKTNCDYKPHKQEKERIWLTVGGDRLDYYYNVATSTADITTFKIIINSTLSAKDAAIKKYYPGTPLPRFEYMKMLISRFPEKLSRSTTSTL
jgi:hypothetical protein